MISLFRWLVGFVFPEIDRKPFAISIFRPEFAVKAFSYLVLIILLSACGGALISGRSVTNQMPPKEWYSTCGKYRWTYKDMNKSMRDLVDQHLLFIPSEIKAYDLAPEDFNAQFKRIMMAYAALPESVRQIQSDSVYVNGGLNGVDAVKDRAANLIPCMVADDYFPVFLIWDSHWWSSYNEQKIYVRDGRFEKGFRLTIPFDYLGDIGQGLIRAPVVYFEQGTWFLNPFLSGDFRMRETPHRARICISPMIQLARIITYSLMKILKT